MNRLLSSHRAVHIKNKKNSVRTLIWMLIIGIHAGAYYAITNNMSPDLLPIVKTTMQAVVIQEVIIPPPPPPPLEIVKTIEKDEKKKIKPIQEPVYVPQVETPSLAPSTFQIESTYMPPVEMPKIEQPAPVGLVASVATPEPIISTPKKPESIGVVCPSQVAPEMPRRAIQEGTAGTVVAKATMKGGQVLRVDIISGPRVFHEAVRSAMMKYSCKATETEVTALQEFNFTIE